MTPRSAGALIALDIGGTAIKGVVAPPSGASDDARRWPTPPDPRDALAAVFTALRALADRADSLGGIGIASTGIVDEDRGVVEFSSSIGWRGLDLADRVSAEFGVPVAVVQDMDAAARAEQRADPTLDGTFCYVGLGTGIGATTVIDGIPRRGSTGVAGELGHIRVSASAHVCPCGAIGCLDTVASGRGVGRRYAERSGRDLTVGEIVARRATDRVADAVWREGCAALGEALRALVLVMDPGTVILGGGLSLARNVLLEPVREAFAASSPLVADTVLRLSRLGDRASLTGAMIAAEGLVQ